MRLALRAPGAWWASALVLLAACAPPEPPANVVLVTFDTTRADHLGPYGDAQAHTPTLDRLAAEGAVFERCKSAAPITVPSHSTIFTGTYPNVHGVRDNGLYVLSEQRSTMAEILRDAGWRTAAAIGSFVLDARFGTAQGFELYDDEVNSEREDFWGERAGEKTTLFFDERSAEATVDAVLPWVRERSTADEPFFLWLHLWSPHHPHIPPMPWSQLFATDLYRGEIAYADTALGKVIAELDALGEAEQTYVIMTADHGEGQGEHGEQTHAILAHDATLHVPWIMKGPGIGAGRRLGERVGTVDILPTLLDLLGLPIPDDIQGRSHARWLRSGEVGDTGRRRTYYAETLSPRLSHGWGELRVWYEGPWKYVHGPRPELFHVESDPRERQERGSTDSQLAQSMAKHLAAYLERTSETPAADAIPGNDPEVQARLTALGYVSSSGQGPESIEDVLRADGIPPQDRVMDISLWSRAKHHLARGEYLLAREVVERLLRVAPDNDLYLILAAYAEMGLGHDRDALDLVAATDDIPARYGPLVAELAMRIARHGEREQAIALMDRVIANQPGAKVWVRRAELFRGVDRQEQVRSLEAALVVDENHVPAHVELGTLLAEDGDSDGAARYLRRALELDPVESRAHYNYGALLSEQPERMEDARRHLARAVELEPASCAYRLGLLTLLISLEETEAAVEVDKQLRPLCGPQGLRKADALMASLAERDGLFEMFDAMEDEP